MTLLPSLLFIPVASVICLFGLHVLTVLAERVEQNRLFADAEELRLAVLSGAVRSTRPATPAMPARLRTNVYA